MLRRAAAGAIRCGLRYLPGMTPTEQPQRIPDTWAEAEAADQGAALPEPQPTPATWAEAEEADQERA